MILDNPDEINFLVKKTTELDKEEINQINDLYNQVFESYINSPRNYEDFLKKFTSNEKKYSYHGLYLADHAVYVTFKQCKNSYLLKITL